MSLLMLFKEIIAVFPKIYTKPIYRLCGQNTELLIVKAGGTYNYCWIKAEQMEVN
jgi:hypothetical protein